LSTRGVIASCTLLVALSACSSDVTELSVAIDANNDCTLGTTRIVCRQVAAVIKTRYPTSKPRVDICLDKAARYEAAVEVMNSVAAAGFPVGNFDCKASKS